MNIRTRFAPSPTGYVHIGNIRAALFPYLLAKQNHGTFVLRIEDTDQNRYVADAEQVLLDTLKWLGLNWDEGVEVGGPFGPYRQTERREHYLKWAQKLIDKGLAYADPYTPEQVQQFREEAQANKQAFLYRNYRPENPPEWHLGLPLRFKQTKIERKHFHDEIMGDLEAGAETLDDFVLIKADGLPTYNFAHVVDDFEMEITHLTRGVEYISSMGNYLALYEALEITPPVFVHMPHIMAPTGNKKLGKRDGAKSVQEYRAEGFLPEAILNFLVMLGWNDGTTTDIFSLDDMIAKFDLTRVQRAGARFDEKRLLWLNGQWLRRLDIAKLFEYARNSANPADYSNSFWGEHGRIASDERRLEVLAAVQERLKTLADLPALTEYFFAAPQIDLTQITENKFLASFAPAKLVELLEIAISALETTDWNADALQNTLNDLLARTATKPAELFSLLRIAVSFAPFSPELPRTLAVLGKDETISRLKKVMDTLAK
ncbi:MAG: glutamate--tRNA ligase [Candidatus Nomurabacteria bacterium]|jgi:glutamyl-tRNA synthetase|nr:glutamate--tRNA ligase [Candidatus Nomurabacteria bacterium]